MLIEGQKDWSEHEDTGEFQNIPQKIKRRKAPQVKAKRPRQRGAYDTALTRFSIEKAATADETVRAKSRIKGRTGGV